jgi:hypothetical protein
MTPKEKAKELIERFKIINYDLDDIANHKECALIAVDLLIECTPSMNIYPPNFQSKHPRVKEYWEDVKQEIELL